MTNPWTQYLQTSDTVSKVVSPESNNPWDSYTQPTQPKQDETGFIQTTINRIRNMGTVIGMGMNLANRTQLTPTQTEALSEFAKVQQNNDAVPEQVSHDISNMFSKASISDAAKILWGKVTDSAAAIADHPIDAMGSAVGTIAALPYHMAESIAGSVTGSILGVDLSGRTVRALSAGEQADQVKALIGNAAAAIVAPAASKMIEGALGAGVAAPAESMTTGELGQIANANTLGLRLGKVGRSIADDVIAGASAGMVQGAITDANKGDVLASMATGLLFAPLGVITGYFRGIKGGLGELESRQINASEIKATRDWQQIKDANDAAKKAVNLLTADRIDEALGTPEMIHQAAVMDIHGNVHEGASHAEILRNMRANGINGVEYVRTQEIHPELGKINVTRPKNPADAGKVEVDGFTTTQGRFLDRTQADELIDKNEGLQFDYKNAINTYGTSLPRGLIAENLTEFAPKATIEDLYNAFKPTLNETDSFTSSLVTFAEKHGLKDHLDELAMDFSNRYIKDGAPTSEYEHLANLQRQVEENRKGPFEHNDEDLIQTATQRGFYFTNNHGALEIRDIDTGNVMHVANTSKEAAEFMNKTGEVPNTPTLDAGAVMPANVDAKIAPSAHPQMNADWQPIYTNRMRMMAGFDLSKFMSPLTGIRPFTEGIDMLTSTPGEFANSGVGERVNTRPMFGTAGTNIKNAVLLPLEHAALKTTVLAREYFGLPVMKRIDAVGRRVGQEGREHVGTMLEANTIEGLMAPNGYMDGHTVAPEALQLAQFMNENAVDHGLVLNYRRARDAAKFQAIQDMKTKAAETYQNAISQGAPEVEALQQYTAQSSVPFDQTPLYQNFMAMLDSKMKPDANFMKAVDSYDALYEKPNGVDNASAVARLKLALDQPDRFNITKEDYIAKNNISPEVVRLHDLTKQAYDMFGTKFGISGRKIMNYMNHYRQVGDISDAFMLDTFERGIMDDATRRFASEMIRSGEIVNYSKDAIGNLYSYIRGGAKRELYSLLNDIGGEKGALATELGKIADPKLRSMVVQRFDQYTRDIVGQSSMTDREALAVQVHVLKNLVEEGGKRKSLEEIIAEVNKPNNLDTLLNLSSAGLLGGRVSLAMRDNFDVWQKYYVRNGGERLWNMLRTKVDDKIIDNLVSEGNIVNPDPLDIINVTHQLSDASKIPGARGRNAAITLNQASKELARFGFETSLQGRAYLRNQAAVFLETVNHTNGVLNDLASGKLTKDAAYEKLFINKYDIPTQRIFDAYVKDGLFGDAVKLLAKEEVVQSVTRMTRGNQAPIANTAVGKLFGQMGSWGMANRTVLENMLTRGTTKEVARSMTRYAISLNATILAGAASGLNLGRWLLLPMSVVATGGPVLGFGQAIVSGTQAALSGDPSQTNFTNRAIKTGLKQFVPFSYMGTDLIKGTELAKYGEGYGVMRTSAQLMGIGVNKTNRNMLDIITGNYPLPPEVPQQ